MIWLALLALLLGLGAEPGAASLAPHQRCSGQRMYYTPLLSRTSELGVCDSSCFEVTSSALFRCDSTPTLPEDDLDPATYADKFPFNLRTCFAARHKDLDAQLLFEQMCIEANGQFTNPKFKTWLQDKDKTPS